MPALPCRLIIDPPGDGAWNMAVDDALLEAAARDGGAALRFYRWSEPTLSLGYFQAHAQRDRHPPSRGCACVRRHSGGGAILHHYELTYSLTVPAKRALARDPHVLYLAAHRSLAGVLQDAAGPAHGERISVRGQPRSRPDREPFLCFQRCALGDLVVGTPASGVARDSHTLHKVAGSSQRKRHGVVLQHGSVLLARSPHAPELPGIAEALGVELTAAQLADAWAPRLAAAAGLALEARGLDERTAGEAERLAEEKFSQPAWLARR